MKKLNFSLVLLGAIAAMGLTPVLADEKAPPAPTQEKPEKASKKFKGKVEAVDATARTLTVGGAVIYTTDSTKITKAGKSIKLAEILVGDDVHGTSKQSLDGKTEALTVKLGKEEPDKPAPKY